MVVLAVFMTFVLGWANRAFHVDIDPRVEAVIDALPGANCGGCGFVGCSEYAEAVVAGKISADKCPVGGPSCAEQIAEILGIEIEESLPYRPIIHCGANYSERLGRGNYLGEQTCGSANVIGGVQGCTYGCTGFGDCATACTFDAIEIIDGLAVINYEKCVGCGACAKVCPRNIISMVPFKAEKMLAVTCSNHDFGKNVKAVCKVGCLGCKACARASDLFIVENNISRVDYDKYDPEKMDAAMLALDKCPTRRVVLIGHPSEIDLAAFSDEEAPEIAKDDFKSTVDKTDWRG